MDFISIFLIFLLFVASPVMGVIRGVKNGSVPSALASMFVPAYGAIYFFVARR